MGYNETVARRFANGRDRLLRLFAALGSAVLSNRGISVCALLGCIVLAQGPWLRPPMSRDFRGGHIPWSTSGGEWFLPESANPTPRAWRWDGVAVPLILIAAGGAAVAAIRPRSTPVVFGLLLAMSVPATAAVLWNHPVLFESFETELRGRRLLRKVFRSESRDLLVGDSPDRLAKRWGKDSVASLLPVDHSLLQPWRYTVYGPWLVIVSAAGIMITRTGDWMNRLGSVVAWGGIGVLVAIAVTMPRLRAEYHWSNAERYEASNRFDLAETSLERARAAMPEFAASRRYWRDRGRLDFRRGSLSRFHLFFESHQLGLARRFAEAQALLSERIDNNTSELVERDLIAEFHSELAARQAQKNNFVAAERQWNRSSQLVPWNPVYWVGGATVSLWGEPQRAAEIERALVPRMDQIGDRVMNSDIASIIGDAYFKTGAFREARSMYALSLANFNLPKHVNLRAQYGRLGM